MYVKVAVLLLVLYGASRLARLLFHSISSEREYLADAGAIIATRDPEALLALLLRIESTPSAYPSSLMPLMLAAPDFDVTHPPLRRRIQILSDLLNLPASADLQTAYATVYRRKLGRTLRGGPALSVPRPETAQGAQSVFHPDEPTRVPVVSTQASQVADQLRQTRCVCGLECEVMPGFALRCPQCHVALNSPISP